MPVSSAFAIASSGVNGEDSEPSWDSPPPESSTVTAQYNGSNPVTVTVIVAVPSLTAVTLPSWSTVATSGSLLAQLTAGNSALAGFGTTFKL